MVETRAVLPGDEGLLFEIYASTRRPEFAGVGWSEGQLQAFLRMQYQAQCMTYQAQHPGADHRIILQAGMPAGRIITVRTAEAIRLIDISLLPQYRNAGIGTALIKSLQAAGVPVRLHVFEANPARRLYERLGFSVAGEAPPYLEMEWHPQV